jgi:hypothetical protein
VAQSPTLNVTLRMADCRRTFVWRGLGLNDLGVVVGAPVVTEKGIVIGVVTVACDQNSVVGPPVFLVNSREPQRWCFRQHLSFVHHFLKRKPP